MKALRTITALCLIACPVLRADDLLDRLDEALTFYAEGADVRARLSGLFDLEYYHFQQPSPGLIYSSGHDLLNPRLTLSFDAQLGPKLYVFLQSRLDRGFDPSDGGARLRLDEYAVRFTPWDDGRVNVQIGRFATVVGNWLSRHQSWDNPFINAPLVYENVTAIYDVEAHPSARDFVAGLLDAKYEYNPAIWGPSYATGASVSGRTGKVDYAVEIKNASLSSRPESWDALDGGFSHPTVSGRIGYRPDAAWNIGFSASDGAYFRPEAAPSLPAGKGIGDYHERVLGQDISFAWHHLQLWAEVYEARFNVPHVGAADTVAWYFEAKYKFTPQMFAAFRWNQQVFNNVSDGGGGRVPWGHDIWRADTALGYRFTPHTQLKLQYSFQHETSSVRDISHMIAAQFTVRF